MEQIGEVYIDSELDAVCEDADMYELCEKVEHCEFNNSFYDEELYNICAGVEKEFNQPPQNGEALKRSRNIEETVHVTAKRSRIEEGASTSSRPDADNEKAYVITAMISTPAPPTPFPGIECVIREGFKRHGVPESALDVMLASLSKSTRSRYTSSLKQWWEYCTRNGCDVYNVKVNNLLDFLGHNFRQGSSYGSLNNHRSAISLISNVNIRQDDKVKRFFKAIFKLRPTLPRYCNFTWDPNYNSVLDYLDNCPNVSISLDKLSRKLVMLLALASGQRTQTLSSIKIPNIKFYDERILITIKDIVKTSGIRRHQPILILPYFHQRPNICPAATLKKYLELTASIRRLNDINLFIICKKPHKAASPQTLGRWIKQTLRESGNNTSIFRAQSTRHAHASTPAGSRAGMSNNIDAIRRATGGSNSPIGRLR